MAHNDKGVKPESTGLGEQTKLTVDELLSDFDDSSFESALARLDEQEKESEQEEETEEKSTDNKDAKAAVAMAQAGFILSENIISAMSGVDFKYDEASKNGVLEALEPLIDKHGLTWLAWFDRYREEMVFAVAFGGLAFTSWTQLRKARAEQIQKHLEQEQAEKIQHIKQKEAELEQAKQDLSQAA